MNENDNAKKLKKKEIKNISNSVFILSTILAVSILITISIFLFRGFDWIFQNSDIKNTNLVYRIQIFHLISALLKNSIAIFTGFGLVFFSSAIVFYTLREKIDLDVNFDEKKKLKISTFSPGIIGLILGTIIVITATIDKDTFDASHLVMYGTEDNIRISELSDELKKQIVKSYNLETLNIKLLNKVNEK